MIYNPQRIWNIAETEITLPNDNGHWLYLKVPLAEGVATTELIASEEHIDPLRDETYVIYKWGYIHPVAFGAREVSMLWGNGRGRSGVDGKSAYEIALLNGFVGTEAQWLASLVGADGEPGAAGSNGADGAPGAPGASGRGIASIALTNTVGLVKTYTITFTDATTYDFDITDGEDGTGGGGSDVVAGDGMDFTTNDPVTLGMPSDVDSTSENQVVGSTHSHKLGQVDISSIIRSGGYGALYNWYAATDVRELTSSPDWMVPSQTDWEDFLNYFWEELGGDWLDAAIDLRIEIPAYWNLEEGVYAYNTYGFSVVGAGFRDNGFDSIRVETDFWTNTDSGGYGISTGTQHTTNRFFLNENEKYFGFSIRLVRQATTEELLLEDGSNVDDYVGNDGKTYVCVKLNTLIWMTENLNETQYRNLDYIHGYEGGVYTPISDPDWDALMTEAMCYYDDDERYGAAQTPLSDLFHKPVTIHPDSSTRASIDENQILTINEQAGSDQFLVHLIFDEAGAITYPCPFALKFTAMINQQVTPPTLSTALNTDMAQYDVLTVTADAAGLVTLTGTWL